jgi:hypothetical protein
MAAVVVALVATSAAQAQSGCADDTTPVYTDAWRADVRPAFATSSRRLRRDVYGDISIPQGTDAEPAVFRDHAAMWRG